MKLCLETNDFYGQKVDYFTKEEKMLIYLNFNSLCERMNERKAVAAI